MVKRLKRVALEIYIITDGDGWVKIGISAKPRKRLADIQISNPRKLKLFVAIPIPHAVDIERDAHLLLAKSKQRGEWFNVSEIEALLAITTAINARYGIADKPLIRPRCEYEHTRRRLPPFGKIARYGDKAYNGNIDMA